MGTSSKALEKIRLHHAARNAIFDALRVLECYLRHCSKIKQSESQNVSDIMTDEGRDPVKYAVEKADFEYLRTVIHTNWKKDAKEIQDEVIQNGG